MRRNLLHMMKDELIVVEHQVDGARLLFIHRCINFFAILVSPVRSYCNLYLLRFIVTMYWTKFLFELYSNSRVLIHYIGVILFFVSIIGCHNYSYSDILIVFCTFKFSSMTLLSLSFVCIGYCTIELRIHYPSWFYKAIEAKDLCAV